MRKLLPNAGAHRDPTHRDQAGAFCHSPGGNMPTSVLARALKITSAGSIAIGAAVLPGAAAHAVDPAPPEGSWAPGIAEHCFCGAAGIDFTALEPGSANPGTSPLAPAPLGSVTGQQSWAALFSAGTHMDNHVVPGQSLGVRFPVRTVALPDLFIAEGDSVDHNPYATYSATTGLVTQSVCGAAGVGASANYGEGYTTWYGWSFDTWWDGSYGSPRPIADEGVHYAYSVGTPGTLIPRTPSGLPLAAGTLIGDAAADPTSGLDTFRAETGSSTLSFGAGEILDDADYASSVYTGTALPADAAGYPREWMDRYVDAHAGATRDAVDHDHDLINVSSIDAPGTYVSFRVVVVNSSETVDDAIDLKAASSVDVFANDTIRSYAQAQWTSATKPAHGTITWTGSQVEYVANPGFPGTDSFTYTVTDELTGHTTTATVTVTGKPIPAKPSPTPPVKPSPSNPPTKPADPAPSEAPEEPGTDTQSGDPLDPDDAAPKPGTNDPLAAPPKADDEPRDSLAATGAAPIAAAVLAGLGIVGAGLAALVVSRRRA